MGNIQTGGGSRPIKTIKDDLEKEKAAHPDEETQEMMKLREELGIAFQRRDEITEKLKDLEMNIESIGVADEEENAKAKAEIEALKAELATLTEGLETELDEGNSNIGNNSSSVNVQPNTNEGNQVDRNDDLSPERCRKILKIPNKSENSEITDETPKTETENLFGSLYNFIFGIFKSSYWAETDEDRCREILKEEAIPQSEEGHEPANPQPKEQPTQGGGRRHTHKNRESRRKTRKQ